MNRRQNVYACQIWPSYSCEIALFVFLIWVTRRCRWVLWIVYFRLVEGGGSSVKVNCLNCWRVCEPERVSLGVSLSLRAYLARTGL